ncbi:MAG: carbohydrate binding domain-containing protein [Candidatus Omnitrophota bacterium]|nr:carbohydrate binding domain-containing protein [Candidatus Omnitrophota bacterium]
MGKFIILIMVMFLFIPASDSAVLVGKNILPNGSFENRPGGGNEDPRNWGSWNSDYNGIATNEFRSGSQSVYLRCPKTNDVGGVFYTYKKIKPGKEYTFSCYAKNSLSNPVTGNAFGQISIEWQKKARDNIVEISRSWGPTFGPELAVIKWTPFTMTATAPTDTDQCSFVIQFFNRGDGCGELFVDDVEAEELESGKKVKSFLIPGY